MGISALDLLLFACGEAPDRPIGSQEFTRADSSGVEIVEVPDRVIEELPVWRLADTPMLSVGVVEGDLPYVLSRIGGAARFDDGGIAIAEGYGRGSSSSAEIRLYDRDGLFTGRTGRYGAGPGEFQGLLWLERLQGDTMAGWDLIHQRVSVLSRGDGPVRDRSTLGCPALEGRRPDGACYFVVGVLDDGSLIVADNSQVYALGAETGPKLGRTVTLGRVAEGEYEPFDSLTQGDQYWATIPGGPAGVQPYPRMYGARPHWTTNGDLIAYGRGDGPEIRFADGDGRLVRILRFPSPLEPVTEGHIRPYHEHDWGGTEAIVVTARDWIENFEPAPFVPRFGELLLDEVGRLWMRDYYPPIITPEDEPRWWTVFAADGAPLARIALPSSESFLIHQIDADAILGEVRDSLGVPRVEVRAILRD